MAFIIQLLPRRHLAVGGEPANYFGICACIGIRPAVRIFQVGAYFNPILNFKIQVGADISPPVKLKFNGGFIIGKTAGE